MACFSIPENATDPLDIMNAVMTFDYPPPHDLRWERRIAALCDALAARNVIVDKLYEWVGQFPIEQVTTQDCTRVSVIGRLTLPQW